MIQGRPSLFRLQAIPSTIHGTVKFKTTNGALIVTTHNTQAKPLTAIAAWATTHITRKRRITTTNTHTVKHKRTNIHTQYKKKGRQPQANNPGGGGDCNIIATPKTSRIVIMNTKKGWTSMSVPTCLRTARAHSMEKKEMKEQTCGVTKLDWKHKQGTTNTRAERISNYPKKEDVDRRRTTTIRVCNW
uniref:Uncharacterized protein n=1 Tax=Lactuca sativa TaxID=4236 RepID=A0A9R1XRZ7_LACSA|nr:hypothetical protein LSAT_V11C200066490 [Lactuca sativa]